MRTEEQFQEVLYSIETQVVEIFRADPKLNDASVLRAYQSANYYFTRKTRKLPDLPPALPPKAGEIFNNAISAAKLYTESQVLVDASSGEESELPAIYNSAIIAKCFKKLEDSVQFWTKRDGAQGYLKHISKFV